MANASVNDQKLINRIGFLAAYGETSALNELLNELKTLRV